MTKDSHKYVYSKERTVVCRAVLLNTNESESSADFCTVKSCKCGTAHIGERRDVWNWWTRLARLEYWNGLNCCKKPFSNLLHALFRHPARKLCRSKVNAYLISFWTKRLELVYPYKSSPPFSHLHAVNTFKCIVKLSYHYIMFLGMQTFHLARAPKARLAMLTVSHRYMYILTEAL